MNSLLTSNISIPNGRWTSNWTIPIEINRCLLPTLCSSLAARLYSLRVQVSVAGVRQEYFKLEVPLQVIHSPKGRLPEAACMQDSSAEAQRAPEVSWLGVDSVRNSTSVIHAG
jgi:hypothetical protein